jgi:hypothetical protein
MNTTISTARMDVDVADVPAVPYTLFVSYNGEVDASLDRTIQEAAGVKAGCFTSVLINDEKSRFVGFRFCSPWDAGEAATRILCATSHITEITSTLRPTEGTAHPAVPGEPPPSVQVLFRVTLPDCG